MKPIDLPISVYGYKSQISINWIHRLIRCHIITDAARNDGGQFREGLVG